MIAALLTGLYDEVLIDVPGVMQNVALAQIRQAAIEFCDRTKCWVVDHDPLSSVANQAAYQFEPEAGTEVCGVIQAWYNGVMLTPRTAAQLEQDVSQSATAFVAGVPWKDQAGTPKYYTFERPDELILVPYPDTAIVGGLVMKVALKPTRTATVIEKWVLDQYYEALAHGAKYRLFAMQKKPWTDGNLATYHKREFELAMTGAAAHSSFKLPEMVSAISPI